MIVKEKENFINHVVSLPIEWREWRDVITLENLQAYYFGPQPALAYKQERQSSKAPRKKKAP